MIRVLLDTDVVLDYLLDRKPFAEAAGQLWTAGEHNRIEIYVSAATPLNLFYIAAKLQGAPHARNLVASLLRSCRICTLDQATFVAAQNSALRDYEDAVQAITADFYQLDYVVTRNVEDYKGAPVAVIQPAALATQLTGANRTGK